MYGESWQASGTRGKSKILKLSKYVTALAPYGSFSHARDYEGSPNRVDQ